MAGSGADRGRRKYVTAAMILRLVESQSSPGGAPVDMPTTIVGAIAALAIAIGCLNSFLRGPTQQELVAKADPIC